MTDEALKDELAEVLKERNDLAAEVERLRETLRLRHLLEEELQTVKRDLQAEVERLRNWLADERTQSSPWPDDVWPMTMEEFLVAVPDEQLRMAISGCRKRAGWQFAVKSLRQALEERRNSNE